MQPDFIKERDAFMNETLLKCGCVGYDVIGETTGDTLNYEETPVLRSKITLPKLRTTGAAINYIKINAWYQNLASQDRNHARLVLYPAAVDDYLDSVKDKRPFNTHEFLVTYEAQLVAQDLFSATVDTLTYEGGANPTTVRAAQTWLTGSGYMLKAEDFFKPACRYKDLIFSNVLAQAEEKAEELALFPDFPVLLKKYLDWNNYYLTCSEFVLFYQPVTIAPHSSGIVEFKIPLSKMRFCIRDCFLKQPNRCDDRDCCDNGVNPLNMPPLYR